jgi:hypothetical protein
MSFAGFTDAEKEQYRTRQTDAKESLLILHSMAAGLSSTSPTNDWWGNVSENDRRVLENLYYRARHVGFPAEYSWGASLGIEQLALLSALPDDIPVKVELIKSAAEASTSNDEAVTSLVEELQTSQESDRDKRLSEADFVWKWARSIVEAGKRAGSDSYWETKSTLEHWKDKLAGCDACKGSVYEILSRVCTGTS